MPRGKPQPPAPKGRSREFLFNAETTVTSTDESDERKSRGKKQKGEKVEAPSAELIATPKHDWGKIGVYVALGLAATGAIYNYADLASLVRNTAEDVKDLKKRSDEMLRSSIETSARVGVLERRDAKVPMTQAASAPSNPAPKK